MVPQVGSTIVLNDSFITRPVMVAAATAAAYDQGAMLEKSPVVCRRGDAGRHRERHKAAARETVQSQNSSS
jgi:hypothetical protein